MIAHISPSWFWNLFHHSAKEGGTLPYRYAWRSNFFYCGNVNSSVRELEGAFKQVVGYCQIKNVPLYFEKRPRRPLLISSRWIFTVIYLPKQSLIPVCKYYNVKKEQVLGKIPSQKCGHSKADGNVYCPWRTEWFFSLFGKNISIKTTVRLSMLTNEYKKNSKIMTGREKELKDILTLLKKEKVKYLFKKNNFV